MRTARVRSLSGALKPMSSQATAGGARGCGRRPPMRGAMISLTAAQSLGVTADRAGTRRGTGTTATHSLGMMW